MRRRRNSDWDDLPPMFATTGPAQLPAPAPVTPERPPIAVPLDFPFWQIKDVRLALDVLERTGDPVVNRLVTEGRFGDALFLPDLEAATLVHSAVRSIVTDPQKDDRTRTGALEIIKRIEAVTGLSPNQGLVSKQTYELVAHAQTSLVSSDRYMSLVRTQAAEDPNRVKRVMDMFPEVFRKAYADFWNQYELLGVEEQITLAGGEVGDRIAARHFWAMSEALWAFAEMLGKTGVEARVIERQVFDPSDFVIWFHDPADPFLLEIELAPELFWDLDTGALHATGRVELPERGFSYFLNRIDKGEEDEWLDTFEEGIQPNPGDVVLWHGTLRDRVPQILRDGIDVGEGWGGAGTSGVFLSGSPEGALYWAKIAFLREQGEKLETARFDRKWGPQQDEILAVLRVTVPASATGGLRADMEQAEDVGFEGEPEDWQASLTEIGDVMHDGRVPAEWVEEWPVRQNPSESDIPPHAAPPGGTTKRVEKFVIYRHKPCEKKTGKPVVWRRGFTVDVDRWIEKGSPEGAARYVPPRTRVKETWWAADARGVVRPHAGPPGLPCPVCGREVWGSPVRGVYRADIACTTKCVAALGSDCECSCAGKNHGSAHG